MFLRQRTRPPFLTVRDLLNSYNTSTSVRKKQQTAQSRSRSKIQWFGGEHSRNPECVHPKAKHSKNSNGIEVEDRYLPLPSTQGSKHYLHHKPFLSCPQSICCRLCHCSVPYKCTPTKYGENMQKQVLLR